MATRTSVSGKIRHHASFSAALILLSGSAVLTACGAGKFESCKASKTCDPEDAGGAGGLGGRPVADAGADPSGGMESGSAGALGSPGGGSDAGGTYGGDSDAGDTSRGGADAGGTGGGGGYPGAGGGGRPIHPDAAGSGGDAGSGGEDPLAGGAPSSAGAGNNSPTAGKGSSSQCTEPADCNDGLFCNGAEQCVAGVCQPGTAPCSNPDAKNCEATCDEGKGAAVCGVQGVDKDRDGARSNACAQKRGTDCDDGRASILPGAPELCDGLDNDCDGKIDLADGLGLSGSNDVLVDPMSEAWYEHSISWSPEQRIYGLSWHQTNSANNRGAYFQTFNQSGNVQVVRQTLVPPDGQLRQGGALAWGGDRFGFLFADSNATVTFTYVRADGTVPNQYWPIRTASSSGAAITLALARLGTNNWGVSSTECTRSCVLHLRTMASSGALVDGFSLSAVGGGIAAVTNNRFVVAYDTLAGDFAELHDGKFAAQSTSPISLASAGTVPVVGASANGFAIATERTAQKPLLSLYDSAGKSVCPAVELGDASFVPDAVVGNKDGYLVVSRNAVRVQAVSKDCVAGPVLSLDSTARELTAVRAAGGDDGFAVVWKDDSSKMMRRLFGPRLCN